MDAAKDGDTIIVYSGTYEENVDVNKELTIISQSGNPEDTIVQAFKITANNVTINGFKLDGGDREIRLDGAQYNNISNNEFYQISLISSSNNTVRNNICNGGIYCLRLSGSDNNLLSNNSISAMEFAISIDNSNNNILIGNSIGGEHPLWLEYSCNNTMSDNSISGTWEGIKLSYSSNNNTISNNYVGASDNAIEILSSNNNVIYNNYLNCQFNCYDDGNNIWNITKTAGTNIVGGPFLGGNYWSNYAGTDTDGDGLGDTLLPYWGDYLPLVKPAEPPEPAAEYITVNNGAG